MYKFVSLYIFQIYYIKSKVYLIFYSFAGLSYIPIQKWEPEAPVFFKTQ